MMFHITGVNLEIGGHGVPMVDERALCADDLLTHTLGDSARHHRASRPYSSLVEHGGSTNLVKQIGNTGGGVSDEIEDRHGLRSE